MGQKLQKNEVLPAPHLSGRKAGRLLVLLILLHIGYLLWAQLFPKIYAQNSERDSTQTYRLNSNSGDQGQQDLEKEFYLESRVNWDKTTIDMELSVPIKKLELQTRYYVNGIIESNFSVWLYDSIKNLQVNSQQTLQDFWGGDSLKNPYTFLKTVLKKRHAVFYPDLKSFRALYRVNLVPDLMRIWVNDNFQSEELAPAILNKNATEFTGLVIYSSADLPIRGESHVLTAQQPGLLPRIYDEDLRLIMSYRNVNKNALLSHGMLSYDVKENIDKHKELLGDFPMRIVVRELFGTACTDMVIGNADAKALLENRFMRDALKEGRILVLLDSEINQSLYSEQPGDDAH